MFQQQNSKEDQNAAIRAALTARNKPDDPLPVQHSKPDKEEIARKPYQFLLVNVLREYLAFELRTPLPFPYDPERVYDDFGGTLYRTASPQSVHSETSCSCFYPPRMVDLPSASRTTLGAPDHVFYTESFVSRNEVAADPVRSKWDFSMGCRPLRSVFT